MKYSKSWGGLHPPHCIQERRCKGTQGNLAIVDFAHGRIDSHGSINEVHSAGVIEVERDLWLTKSCDFRVAMNRRLESAVTSVSVSE